MTSDKSSRIAVASYVGKSADQALNELTEAGFMVSSLYGFSEIRLAGEVISQKPEGGKSANKGSEVELLVSKGSQFAYIPNIFSIEEAQAVQSLKDLELKVVVKKIGNIYTSSEKCVHTEETPITEDSAFRHRIWNNV